MAPASGVSAVYLKDHINCYNKSWPYTFGRQISNQNGASILNTVTLEL